MKALDQAFVLSSAFLGHQTLRFHLERLGGTYASTNGAARHLGSDQASLEQ